MSQKSDGVSGTIFSFAGNRGEEPQVMHIGPISPIPLSSWRRSYPGRWN